MSVEPLVASRDFERQASERISFKAMDTMPSALDMAFRTALLLTGDTRTAEAAVMHGIGGCEDLSPGGLLIEAVRSALRRRTESSEGPCEVECLPPELRRLFLLQPYLCTALFFEFWSASRPKSARNFSKFPIPSSKTRYIER
jgi:hypothetical protein